jgi:hypothetical protein
MAGARPGPIAKQIGSARLWMTVDKIKREPREAALWKSLKQGGVNRATGAARNPDDWMTMS